jgi:release factor glutamine methyltransferase
MNVNLQPKTPLIKDWLDQATVRLVGVGIGTAKLDAEIILAHTLRKPRTYIHAHNEDQLSSREYEIAEARLDLRLDRTPIAYIIGHKDFYGRRFKVTPATLIPRPESEEMITILNEIMPGSKALLPKVHKNLVDVGTGSGILGITAKLEHPELDVTLLDISRHALNVAKQNATLLHADVQTTQSDLLSQYFLSADIILANLPYVDPSWERSPETNQEPPEALFAEEDGLALIKKLIDQTTDKLRSNGYLLLEADPRQHDTIVSFARKYGFSKHTVRGFIVSLQKS